MKQPFLFKSSAVGSVVAWKLFQETPAMQEEFEGTRLLFAWVGAPVQIMTVKKPVKSLDDLNGMKIIGWTRAIQDIPEILGANPINIPPMDTYLALQRSMADGLHFPYATVLPFKLSEATNYATTINSMVTSFYCVIRDKSFNNLPRDLQQVLLDTAGEGLSRKAGASLDKGSAIGLSALKKKGAKIYNLSSAEKASWVQQAMPLREKWLKQMESKGHSNIRQLMNRAIELAKEVK